MNNDYINIGKIAGVHGLNGEVVIKHALGKKTTFKQGDVIFIEQVKGSYLPHFVTTAKAKTTEETILQFDDTDSREKALKFVKKPVWLTEEDFAKYAAKSSSIALLGFTLFNEGEKLGVIDEIIEQTHQVLLTIKINGKEALIPLHEETLDNIDRKKKEVHVTLPDGLLEIYLE